MEIRARYTLIGTFVLASIGAILGFVFWINNAGAIGQRALYRIEYENTVAGLQKGSAVLFNGVRAGEVAAIDLDPRAPKRIAVTIAVAPAVPVRADTKAGIDFQGLSGAPVVALSGGMADGAALTSEGGKPPLLVADPDAGQSVMAAARDAIRRIDTLVAANAEPLHSLVANIDKFAGALAKNADKVDGIVAGIERFTGGAKPPLQVVELKPVARFPAIPKLPAGQLYVPDPAAFTSLDQPRITVRSASGEQPQLAGAQWPDALTKVVQMRIVQSLENAGYLRATAKSIDGGNPDYQLLLDIRRFQVSVGDIVQTEVEYGAKITNPAGKIIAARVLKSDTRADGADLRSVGAAFDRSFSDTVVVLVPWVLASLAASDAAPADAAPDQSGKDQMRDAGPHRPREK